MFDTLSKNVKPSCKHKAYYTEIGPRTLFQIYNVLNKECLILWSKFSIF
jgi:hypothetical protein